MDIEKIMIVRELLSNEFHKNAMESELEFFGKNSKRSQKLRKQGNGLYVKVNLDDFQIRQVFKLYSQSIVAAESNSEDLALAFANRSALLLRMKKYKDGVSDIDRALKISKSDSYKVKLLCRKIECLLIQDSPESEDVFSEIELLMSKINDREKKKKSLDEIVEKAKESMKNHTYTSGPVENVVPEHLRILSEKGQENPFDAVTIKHSERYGRYLTANRDFAAGEIIFVEKPYVRVPSLKTAHLYCSHCLLMSWSMIPCDYCSCAMFCSDNCKKEAWERYHDIECPIIAHLVMNDRSNIADKYRGDYQQLTIRALIMGIKEAGGLDQLRTNLQIVDRCKDKREKGFKKNGTIATRGFESMYALHDTVNEDLLKMFVFQSALLLISLIRCSKFLDHLEIDSVESLIKNKRALFVGSLILKLYKISDQNRQQIIGEDFTECQYSKECTGSHTVQCSSRGSCVVLVNNLINHSCNLNSRYVITKSQTFVTYSIFPIKKNSQIFITYHKSFFDLPRPQRQHLLKQFFNFTCDCAACENNWPTNDQIATVAKLRPDIFQSVLSKTEKALFPKEEGLVRSISNYDVDVFNQKTIEVLSRSVGEATKHLRQPSLTLWKLTDAMQRLFDKLYMDCQM